MTGTPVSSKTPSPREQFLVVMHQVHIMKEYCFSEAIAIPPHVAETVVRAERLRMELDVAAPTDLPGSIVKAKSQQDTEALQAGLAAHTQMCDVVAPATPISIEWTTASSSTEKGAERRWRLLYPMAFVTLLFLAGFVWSLYNVQDIAARAERAQGTARLVLEVTRSPTVAALASESTVSAAALETCQAQVASTRGALERLRGDAEFRSGADGRLGILIDQSLAQLEILQSNLLTAATTAMTSKQVLGAKESLAKLEPQWVAQTLPNATTAAEMSLPDYLMLLFAGALGAAFYNLYWAHQYIVNRTFDPAYLHRYWIRLVLGLVAGLLLGKFGSEAMGLSNGQTSQPQVPVISHALLALVGGYTVEVVNLMFVRLADALTTLFRGTTNDLLQAKEAEHKARESKAKALADQSKTEFQQAVIKRLTALRATGPVTPEQIDRVIKDLS